MNANMFLEKQIKLLIVWAIKVLVSQIKKSSLISLTMLLILVLKIIVGLYLIVCVGSFVRSFFLQKKKYLVVKKKKKKKQKITRIVFRKHKIGVFYIFKICSQEYILKTGTK